MHWPVEVLLDLPTGATGDLGEARKADVAHRGTVGHVFGVLEPGVEL